jgi:hypothetical protein
MIYESGLAWTLAQIWFTAFFRILLITGSRAPSSLCRAISRAWETVVVEEEEKDWELEAPCEVPSQPMFADKGR